MTIRKNTRCRGTDRPECYTCDRFNSKSKQMLHPVERTDPTTWSAKCAYHVAIYPTYYGHLVPPERDDIIQIRQLT